MSLMTFGRSQAVSAGFFGDALEFFCDAGKGVGGESRAAFMLLGEFWGLSERNDEGATRVPGFLNRPTSPFPSSRDEPTNSCYTASN